MTIQLTLADEKLVQRRIQSGAYQSVEEVIHDALATQDAEADWLAENCGIHNRIARGLAQMERGEGAPGDEVRKRLDRRKAEWLGELKLR